MTRSAVRRGGFTLVELILVIGIIAVLSAIVIPNLVASRSASNETAAIAALKAYSAAQVLFRLSDGDRDGVADYATEFRDLYYSLNAAGEPIKLVARNFADADAPEDSAGGYYYEDLSAGPNGAYDPKYEYGLAALPSKYKQTGLNTLVIDVSSVIYQKDRKVGDPLGGEYPGVDEENWVVTGQ